LRKGVTENGVTEKERLKKDGGLPGRPGGKNASGTVNGS
jgi:hypothetical protein